MDDSPISIWISGLKQGDPASAERLWGEYFERLRLFAGRKLSQVSNRSKDDEDIALSAFKSLCNGAIDGKFPKLTDRNSLWPLMALIAARKVYDAATHERRQKRGSGRERIESELSGEGEEQFGFDLILSKQPTPEDEVLMQEACNHLLESLSPEDQKLVQLKLEGHSNDAIASLLGVATRTVERKLSVIRRTWSRVLEERRLSEVEGD